MLRLFTISCFLFLFSASYAQQASQYSMYMLNKYAYNVGYAGFDNSLSATGVYRQQWAGLEDAPRYQQFNIHLPAYILRGGLGVSLENDIAGAERNTSASLSYNYWIPVSKTSMFSVGVSGGIIQKSLDGRKLRTPEGNYEGSTFTHNDLLLPESMVSALSPTFNLGLYYRNRVFEAGLSVTNISEPLISLDLLNGTAEVQVERTYFFTVGTDFEVGSNLLVSPSILVKSNVVQTEIHFSTIIEYNDNIFLGASFRGYSENTLDALAIIAGWKLNEKVSLAYSYDWTFSALNTVSRGSHEILLNYNLGKPIGKGLAPKVIYNPRY